MEIVRQEAVAELHSATQSKTESTRNEATSATAYVANLTKNALNRLKKENQELHQMAENDERLDATPRQMITARKNQLRNQAKEQESPQRAKPKAKSEPFKFNKESMGVKDENDDENPETTHEHKGKRGRPSNTQGPPPVRKGKNKNKDKENPRPTPNPTQKTDHDTEKDMNRTVTHGRKASRQCFVDKLSKHGWRWPKTPNGKNAKLLKPEFAQIMIHPLEI